MSDFLSEALAEQGQVVEKTLTVAGRSGTVWLKRINGAQRQQLLKGQKVVREIGKGSGQAATVEIDLEQNESQRHQLILFCVCKADGSPRYKSADEVAVLPHSIITPLHALVSAFNEEAEGAGKS